jgi:hypothetical protein
VTIDEQNIDARSAAARGESRTPAGNLISRFFRPVDNASLVFFRIAFGLTSFFHIWGVLDGERVRRRYIDQPFLFSFPGLGWLKPLPGDLLLVLWFAMAAACLLVMLGLFYKPAIIFFFVAHTYAIHLDQSIFWNHYYVISLFAFLMIFVPANRAHSLDVVWRHLPEANTAPAWALWNLRGQMAITYFFAGLAKLNSDWLDGRPMDALLTGDRSFPFISAWFDERWMHLMLSWCGIGFDLLIVPLLLWRRTRVPAFIAALGFHFFNSLTLDIEVFPWFAIAATALFFAPDWPRKIGLWTEERAAASPHEAVPQNWRQLRPSQKVGFGVLAVYFVIQILMPLRHYAYPGDVNWTTEGDLWSWRMLIVDARQETVFTAKSTQSGAECLLNPTDYVARDHVFKLGYRPDLMAQFGRHVSDVWWDRTHQRISVHAYSSVSINGHDFAQIVSPDTDLATVERSLHKDWILPEEPAVRPVKPPPIPPCRQ